MTSKNPPGGGQRPRIHSVDGLRGVFAIGVMFYHYTMWYELPVGALLDGFLTKTGIYAVSGFFVISGLSLYHVYQGAMTLPLTREFYLRRFLRIAPLYYAACVIDMLGHVFLGNPYFGYQSWTQFASVAAQNFGLVFGFYRPGETEMVVGGWSIGIEYTFYVFFPLVLVLLAGRLGRMLVLFAGSLVAALTWSYWILDPGLSLSPQWGDYVTPLAYAVYFVSGIVIGCLVNRYRLPNSIVWSGAVVSFLAYVVAVPLPRDSIEAVYGIGGLVLLAATTGLVGFCAFYRNDSRVFVAACKFLGEISYALYLLHFSIFFFVTRFLSIESGAVSMIVAVMLAMFLSAMVYRFFEKPFLRLGHRPKPALRGG